MDCAGNGNSKIMNLSINVIKINNYLFIVFIRRFNKGNRKHFFRISRVIETPCGSLEETQNCVETYVITKGAVKHVFF